LVRLSIGNEPAEARNGSRNSGANQLSPALKSGQRRGIMMCRRTIMPIHDWTRVDAGLFHDFHQDWTIELRRALKAGLLPPGDVALADQQIGGPIPDVLTLHR